MSRKRGEAKPLDTIWRVPDELWDVVEPLIAALDPPKATGRKRIDPRDALNAIIFRMRTGCQWNRLPEEFPDDSSVRRTLQRWQELGLFEKIWATLVEIGDELGGVNWQWQAADGAIGKARLGRTL